MHPGQYRVDGPVSATRSPQQQRLRQRTVTDSTCEELSDHTSGASNGCHMFWPLQVLPSVKHTITNQSLCDKKKVFFDPCANIF